MSLKFASFAKKTWNVPKAICATKVIISSRCSTILTSIKPNFVLFSQTIFTIVNIYNIALSHIVNMKLSLISSIIMISMMISICSIIKQSGVLSTFHNIIKPFVSMHIIGKISEGDPTNICMITHHAKNGKIMKSS